MAETVRIDRSWVSRFERGKAEGISVDTVARILAVVGFDLSLRAYPSDPEVRDGAQVALVEAFGALLPGVIQRGLEVPFPSLGDRRAWDMRLRLGDEAWGVEAETHIHDIQATLRKLKLKARDGDVDGVILLVRDGRHHRSLLRRHASLVRIEFPVESRVALECLAAGRFPAGNAIVSLHPQAAVDP